MVVREVTNKDIDQVVKIHLLAFENFFLSELGERFLCSYYRSFANSERGIVLGCFEEDKMMGFAATAISSRGFNKSLILSNPGAYILQGIRLLFSKPKTIIRLYENMSKTDSTKDDGDYAELFSIGIDPSCQGKGVGSTLLSATEKALTEKKIKRISLTTDTYNNEKALSFYHSMDYDILYEFTAYPDRQMFRLIKTLSK